MKVFKFGGASVKDAPAIRNLVEIVSGCPESLIVVVSAMGKTTNAMEELVVQFYEKKTFTDSYNEIYTYHYNIVRELFPKGHQVYEKLDSLFAQLKIKLERGPSLNYNFEYDQIVCYGELLSTTIIADYLCQMAQPTTWVDIRKYLKTDENYREAIVDFELSINLSKEVFKHAPKHYYVTQGFIGSSRNNITTTLGREGSDYTAALIAAMVGAETVTVWKDVPGVLNADPKYFDNTVKLDKLSYTDAIELAFYGASVLHPKTIQPIMQKNIPLHVKSFLQPKLGGTVIQNGECNGQIPCFIFKVDQVLINIHPRDLSFIAEENFTKIFEVFSKFSLKVNLMQNTAVSFRICVNNDETRIPKVVDQLRKNYKLTSEDNLELITIRNYDQLTIDRVLVEKEVILEQHNSKTVQMVVRKNLSGNIN